jgi:hypothetical protein
MGAIRCLTEIWGNRAMMKLRTIALALLMMMAFVFISDATSSRGNLAANGQIVSDMKRLGRTTYRGGRWVTVRVYRGGKWVTKRVWQGGKWVWRGGKRVFVASKRRL